MKTHGRQIHNGRQAGFALWEPLIAMAIVGILALAVMSSMVFNKVQIYRDRERALVLDFLVHYLETARGLPFADMKKGAAINTLYDGTNGAPNIRIPSTFDWYSVNNTNYLAFHPELALLSSRNPEMRADLTTTQVGGSDNSKQLRVEFRWVAPVNQGGTQHVRLDLFRGVDSP